MNTGKVLQQLKYTIYGGGSELLDAKGASVDGSGTIKRVLKKSHPIKRRREEEKGEFTHFYATHSPKPAKNLRLRRTTCALRAHNGAQRRDSVAP
jgi:hypothetical protein